MSHSLKFLIGQIFIFLLELIKLLQLPHFFKNYFLLSDRSQRILMNYALGMLQVFWYVFSKCAIISVFSIGLYLFHRILKKVAQRIPTVSYYIYIQPLQQSPWLVSLQECSTNKMSSLLLNMTLNKLAAVDMKSKNFLKHFFPHLLISSLTLVSFSVQLRYS